MIEGDEKPVGVTGSSSETLGGSPLSPMITRGCGGFVGHHRELEWAGFKFM